jgi:hypothetical protein
MEEFGCLRCGNFVHALIIGKLGNVSRSASPLPENGKGEGGRGMGTAKGDTVGSADFVLLYLKGGIPQGLRIIVLVSTSRRIRQQPARSCRNRGDLSA